MTKTTAVAKVEPGGVPDYLRDHKFTGSGLQGLDQTDLIIPRVKLLQAISDEVTAFENAKAGIFWLNVMDIPFGPELDFIVISNRKRYLLLPPRGDARGVLARADDGKTWNPPSGKWDVKLKGVRNPVTWEIKDASVRGSGLAEFGSSNPDNPDSNPAATLFYEYLAFLPDFPDSSPALFSLARSQAKKARDLNGKIEFAKSPMQAMRFRAKIVTDTGPEGDYFNYAFVRNGWATEEQFNSCTAMAERFKDYRGADEEGLAEDVGATGNADAAGKEF